MKIHYVPQWLKEMTQFISYKFEILKYANLKNQFVLQLKI